MNAIPFSPLPDDAERIERDLATCRELAGLAMDLARAAARRALHAFQAQEEDPLAAPVKSPDAGLFLRFSTAVRQAIALEHRIAAGRAPARRGAAPAACPPADERRATLQKIFHGITEDRPGRAAVRRDIAGRIEAQIAADPEARIQVGDMLGKICADLGIDIDWNRIGDDILEKLTAPQSKSGSHGMIRSPLHIEACQTPMLSRAGP